VYGSPVYRFFVGRLGMLRKKLRAGILNSVIALGILGTFAVSSQSFNYSAEGSDIGTRQFLRQIEDKLRSLNSVEYLATLRNPDGKVWNARVCLERPYRMRIELDNDPEVGSVLVVSDGAARWEYHPAQHQYFKVASKEDDPNPMVVVVGVSLSSAAAFFSPYFFNPSIVPSLDYMYVGDAVIEGEKCFRLDFTSKYDHHADYYSHKTLMLVRRERFESTGTSVMAIHGLIESPQFQDSLFRFIPPTEAHLEKVPHARPNIPSLTGRPAPPFKGRDQYEHEAALEDYKGRVLLLGFWATWCVPCRSELEMLARFAQRLRDHCDLLLVNEETNLDAVHSFLESKHYSFRTLLGADSLFDAFETHALPELVVIAPDQKIARIFYASPSEAELEELARQLTKPSTAPKPQPSQN
jgi:outer membrane lipoprotein-sorting protein/peroxiredoxin